MPRLDLAEPGLASVITGGGSGIGAAVAVEIARRGGALALVDRDREGLERTREAVRATAPARVSIHPIDVTDGDRVAALPSEVLAAHRGAHVVVNSVGVSLLGSFEQLTLEEFRWLLDINLWGVIAVTKAFLPALMAQPRAHIANLSSVYGLAAPGGRTPYATSKFAVRGFTEALRHELAGGPVSVGVVHPGGIKTGIAMKARLAAAVDPAVGERAARAQTAAYRTTPERAAKVIVDDVERRRGRTLIGADAHLLDLLARVTPGHYWSVLRRSLATAVDTAGRPPS